MNQQERSIRFDILADNPVFHAGPQRDEVPSNKLTALEQFYTDVARVYGYQEENDLLPSLLTQQRSAFEQQLTDNDASNVGKSESIPVGDNDKNALKSPLKKVRFEGIDTKQSQHKSHDFDDFDDASTHITDLTEIESAHTKDQSQDDIQRNPLEIVMENLEFCCFILFCFSFCFFCHLLCKDNCCLFFYLFISFVGVFVCVEYQLIAHNL